MADYYSGFPEQLDPFDPKNQDVMNAAAIKFNLARYGVPQIPDDVAPVGPYETSDEARRKAVLYRLDQMRRDEPSAYPAATPQLGVGPIRDINGATVGINRRTGLGIIPLATPTTPEVSAATPVVMPERAVAVASTPFGNPTAGPRFTRTDMNTGDEIANRPLLQSMTPEQRAGWIRSLSSRPMQWRTSGEADPNPDVAAMIANAQAQKRAELLAQNPALRGTEFDVNRPAALPTMNFGPDEQRAAMLRQNPQLADRIQAERALRQIMAPAPGPATEAITPSRIAAAKAFAEAQAVKRQADAQVRNPSAVPINQSLFQAAIAKRQAQRAQAQQLVSAIARGNRGYVTPETAMMMQASRNPQLAALMQQGGLKQMEILAELQKARMGVDAETARYKSNQEWMGTQNDLNRKNDLEVRRTIPGTAIAEQNQQLAQIEGDIKTLEDQRKATPPAGQIDLDTKINILKGRRDSIRGQNQGGSPAPQSAPGVPISTSPSGQTRSAIDRARMLVGSSQPGEKLADFLRRARMESEGITDADPTGVAAKDFLARHIRTAFPGEIESEKANTFPSLWDRGHYREYNPGGVFYNNPNMHGIETTRDIAMVAPALSNWMGVLGRVMGLKEPETEAAYKKRLWERDLLNRIPK